MKSLYHPRLALLLAAVCLICLAVASTAFTQGVYPYPAQPGLHHPPGRGAYPPVPGASQPAQAVPEAGPAPVVRHAIRVGSESVRVTSAHPERVLPLESDILLNFAPQVIPTPGGGLQLDINGPVIIEEYPFPSLALTNNPQFGATLAGQVNPALAHLPEHDLKARQRRILTMIALAGVGIARDFQSYDTRRLVVEPQPGVFNYENAEQGVHDATQLNINYIGRLGLHGGGANHLSGPPPDERAYLHYIINTVRRFTNRVEIWSTLKEPEPGPRSRPGNDPGLTPEQVVNLLRLSYQAIKSVNPGALVYFPGLGPFRHPSYTIEGYLEQIIALGGARYFDVLGYDAYVFDIVETALTCRRLLNKYGYDKPIWVAQTGVPDVMVGGRVQFLGGGSPRAQSEFMVKAYARAFHQGIGKVFWGEFLDRSRGETAHRPNPWDATGLFYSGTWEVKPAYHTHRLLAAVLDGFQGVEQLSEGLYRFSFAHRSPVYVLWP